MNRILSFALTMSVLVFGACSDEGSDRSVRPADTGAGDSAMGGETNGPDSPDPETSSILDIASSNPDFSILAGALQATGLDEALAGEGPFTVFAPTNAAFEALPAGLVDSLSAEQLSSILLYHVAGGELGSSEVIALDSAPTLNGAAIDIALDANNTVVLNGRVQVQIVDIEADNGVIHVLDAVLIPGPFPGSITDMLAASPRFSTLVGAVVGAELADALANPTAALTVFAPTNNAFDILPEGLVGSLDIETLTAVLTYHVLGAPVDSAAAIAVAQSENPAAVTLQEGAIRLGLDGSELILDGRTTVTFTDIQTQNGVVHVLDSVLVPGTFPGTIPEMLAASPRFSTLVGAVVEAELAGALSDTEAAFTVFAPTNNAFGLLPDGLVASLDIATLGQVLSYHALGAEVDSTTAVSVAQSTQPSADTLQGGAIKLSIDSDELIIDGKVTVKFTDIHTANGIVHVLDSVLTPGPFPGTVVEALASYPRFSTLVGAVGSVGLAPALADANDGNGFTVFAPTNRAFSALPEGLLAGLTEEALTDILLYHVLGITADSSVAIQVAESDHPTVETLQGQEIELSLDNGLFLNSDIEATFTDFQAQNGVIHVIDGVLTP